MRKKEKRRGRSVRGGKKGRCVKGKGRPAVQNGRRREKKGGFEAYLVEGAGPKKRGEWTSGRGAYLTPKMIQKGKEIKAPMGGLIQR